RSTTQVHALGDAVEEKLKKNFSLAPLRTEGFREGRWGVLDYGDVVVHVFNEESRLFYYLERLWDSGKNVTKYED
ncbi:MAG: ribosome silencing factor, partial [Clostridia bacterium]|nr:ribosome silencing factor [Clostridia bacterium]